MREQVVTTKRKKLTPLQRLALFEAFKGKCVLCGDRFQTKEKWTDEHLRALGLGGTNQWDNRAPVHEACAAAKTKDDMTRIRKAKRVKARAVGAHEPKGEIASRPFQGKGPGKGKEKEKRFTPVCDGEPEIMRRYRKVEGQK